MYDQHTISELTHFARIGKGIHVIDVYPGKGDWTRIFSDIVGPTGQVISFVPAEVAQLNGDPVGTMQALAKEPGRQNVEVASADLVALPQSGQPLDVVWMHLFYHDLHTALVQAHGATAADFNRAVHARLKPGGLYIIVDHAAAAGTSEKGAASLHRIAPQTVRTEVESAGFSLDAESMILANDADAHTVKVFDTSVKGKTDRFVYRFKKV